MASGTRRPAPGPSDRPTRHGATWLKRGKDHHFAGAHLPVGKVDDSSSEVLADPARGERVERCQTCGMPARDEPLLNFLLLLMPGRKAAGTYRLCGRCYRHANPPPPADPLDVSTAA